MYSNYNGWEKTNCIQAARENRDLYNVSWRVQSQDSGKYSRSNHNYSGEGKWISGRAKRHHQILVKGRGCYEQNAIHRRHGGRDDCQNQNFSIFIRLCCAQERKVRFYPGNTQKKKSVLQNSTQTESDGPNAFESRGVANGKSYEYESNTSANCAEF